MKANAQLLILSAVFLLASEPGVAEGLIDFEGETPSSRPAGWTFSSDSSNVLVESTTTSGDYTGGQAIRTGNSGASYAGFRSIGPAITSLQADFLWDWSSDGDPTLVVYAWDDNDDAVFQSGERTIGFGMDNDGQFELSSEAGEISGNTNFSADTWYRLTMTWGEPDGSGNRLVTLSAIDLTNCNDLGLVASVTMTPAEFGVAPSEWDGVAFRMTRGTIDNIQISSDEGAGTAYAYVDASPVNTTLNTDPINFPGGVPLVVGSNYIDDGTSGSGTDDLWTYRTDSAFESFEGGNAFECDTATSSGDSESTDDLITTVNLPTAGTYDLVAVFTRSSGRDIAARVGSSPDSGDVFTTANALNADQAADPLEIDFDSPFTNARSGASGVAYLGTVTTSADGEDVRIFVNGLVSTPANDNERTQYEGIGYRITSASPPPPTPKHRDVFILAGQSNSDGRGLKAELTGGLAEYSGQQPGVLIHYTNTGYTNSDKSRYRKWVTLEPGYSRPPGDGSALPTSTFGVEIGAAKALTSQYPNPAFIKVTRGGTALGVPGSEWYPAPLDSPDVGPLYEALIESTQLALAELEAAGETYTVHAIFWHQGESDGGRTSQYGGLLTNLIESVRRDLNMPNLRFVVGELSPTKPQAFRDVQWGVARSVPNTWFLSSSGLTTFDGTHFTTSSMATFGERLAHTLLSNIDTLDFEDPRYAVGALDRQDEWAATGGLGSAPQVVATSTQGEYTGGQAAGHAGASGLHHFNRRHLLPLAGARSLQADFYPGDSGFDNEADADSALLVAGWGTDAGGDGLFNEAEAAIGLGLDDSGTFCIQIGSQTHLATPFNYQIDRWYRLTVTWSEPDGAGSRAVSLFARDLATGTDMNGGAAILSLNVTSSEFDGDLGRWSGIGCRATRGLMDNIRIVPPGFAAWATTLYPALAGGPDDDDDRDGILNGIEFAFGLDPLASSPSSLLPQAVFGPAAATVSFSPYSTQPGIRYLVEWSKNLNSWNTLDGTPTGDLLEFIVPTAGEPSLFIRHRVEFNP